MKLMPIIIASLYDHFYKMKERGRKVVPWVQTVFAFSLSATLLTFMIGNNIMQLSTDTSAFAHISEGIFIIIFLLIGLGYFFLIKSVYFDTEKFLAYYDTFLQFPKRKQTIYRVLVIGLCILLPMLMIWKIWYDAK